MKRKLTGLSRPYQAALRQHLKRSGPATLQPAKSLGSQAMTLGLETLELARIHEQALITLVLPSDSPATREAMVRRAGAFFAEAITPIEKTHHAALKANVRLRQLSKALGRRTLDLAASNRSLKQCIIQRQTVQQALKKSGEHSRKLWKESRRLQQHLQRLTHQILSAQEDKRKKISREVHDEIAQTLLGINVRLLTLKKETAVNARGLKKEIASTQRLVDKSVKSIKRFAREFGIHHRT